MYGPPKFARPSYTRGFPGSAFSLQPDGTLRCPAGHPLYAQERRSERDGSVRLLYAARIGHCRPCPLREQCQEQGTTIKPRRVSAVIFPIDSSKPDDPPAQSETQLAQGELQAKSVEPLCAPTPRPVLWGDWERCRIRRRWLGLLRTQTVTLASAQPAEEAGTTKQRMQTRAQRAHWRLSWDERLARNARSVTAPPLEVTIHGLPAAFAQFFGFGLVAAA